MVIVHDFTRGSCRKVSLNVRLLWACHCGQWTYVNVTKGQVQVQRTNALVSQRESVCDTYRQRKQLLLLRSIYLLSTITTIR